MFAEQTPTILESESPDSQNNLPPESGRAGAGRLKKILLLAALILAVILLIIAVFLGIKKYRANKAKNNILANQPVETSTPVVLPNLPLTSEATTTATSSLSNSAVEYLSFSDFYEIPDNNFEAKLKDYQLPLNVKIDAMNYYDVSRKLNLDNGLDNLNNYGFTMIANPWPKESPDFYSLYSSLDDQQLPLLITSDFVIYYYQDILKKAFKDIEENIFYDNLWSINQELYTAAKNRYEARLAAIGQVNDSVLEGERLETAFFAVALELLKPAANQVSNQGSLDGQSKFAKADADKFYFVTPPYLSADVSREVKLIRAGKGKTKSPILLYQRDYADFVVPADYSGRAKLNNFYLTTKWLNSVWPLNYRTKDCAACLLDREDWRINLIAASLISQDFSSLPELKNKWARIYKIMFFFKGLREDLNYIHYRDSLAALYGENYNIEELFSDKNSQASGNLEKLRAKLLAYDFSSLQGALSKTDADARNKLGFKMLAESYWPSEYLFKRLTVPAVDVYLGSAPQQNNVTRGDGNRRYQGFSLDMVNLASPLGGNSYFTENTNYLNYGREADGLREQLNKEAVWHTTNYWTTLSVVKSLLEADRSKQPQFARTDAWRDRIYNTAAAAWVNFQLPLEKFEVQQSTKKQGLNNVSRWNENSFVEPNLNLLNELIANNNMALKMFAALQMDSEIAVSRQNIQNANNNLSALKKIVLKELQGEALGEEDNEAIADFTKQLKVEAGSNKILSLPAVNKKTGLKENLSQLKLMVLVHQEGDNKVFSVGPVWDYVESR